MMAVIRTGGKQYIVKPQQRVTVEKLLQKVGDVLTFEDVLLITDAENQAVKVGAPVVIGASVTQSFETRAN